jgi:hypothetical protein
VPCGFLLASATAWGGAGSLRIIEPSAFGPVGARNKYGEQFFKDFLADWEQHGRKSLQRWGMAAGFISEGCCSIVPKELDITSQGVAGMSDEDVLRIIDAAARKVELGGWRS